MCLLARAVVSVAVKGVPSKPKEVKSVVSKVKTPTERMVAHAIEQIRRVHSRTPAKLKGNRLSRLILANVAKFIKSRKNVTFWINLDMGNK